MNTSVEGRCQVAAQPMCLRNSEALTGWPVSGRDRAVWQHQDGQAYPVQPTLQMLATWRVISLGSCPPAALPSTPSTPLPPSPPQLPSGCHSAILGSHLSLLCSRQLVSNPRAYSRTKLAQEPHLFTPWTERKMPLVRKILPLHLYTL